MLENLHHVFILSSCPVSSRVPLHHLWSRLPADFSLSRFRSVRATAGGLVGREDGRVDQVQAKSGRIPVAAGRGREDIAQHQAPHAALERAPVSLSEKTGSR